MWIRNLVNNTYASLRSFIDLTAFCFSEKSGNENEVDWLDLLPFILQWGNGIKLKMKVDFKKQCKLFLHEPIRFTCIFFDRQIRLRDKFKSLRMIPIKAK